MVTKIPNVLIQRSFDDVLRSGCQSILWLKLKHAIGGATNETGSRVVVCQVVIPLLFVQTIVERGRSGGTKLREV